jgi:hypothetical protein
MPAFVKRRFGESGIKLEEGTMECPFDLKKSKNDWRIWLLVIKQKRPGAHPAQLKTRNLQPPAKNDKAQIAMNYAGAAEQRIRLS